jgi:hypothetical protein
LNNFGSSNLGDIESDSPLRARNICFQPIPRNGSRYNLVLAEDPNGGVLVVWPNVATWRWYRGDTLKFLHGSDNKVDAKAIFDYLESRTSLASYFFVPIKKIPKGMSS